MYMYLTMKKNNYFFCSHRRALQTALPKREAGGGALRENYISAWQMDLIHPIWNEIGMGMLLDPKNKPTE